MSSIARQETAGQPSFIEGASMLDIARQYIRKGYRVLPIPHKAKAPVIREWGKLRITEADADVYFSGKPQNIGVLLGEPSGNLVDVDLDCDEAVKLAPSFLPSTPAIFGRESKPSSHYLYVTEIKSAKFQNADGQMLVELRSTGGQTVFPHSTHPSGERVTWDSEGTPERVDAKALHGAVARLAACSLLAQAWKGSRHNLTLAIAGGLLRDGWHEDDAVNFILCAATVAGDDELEDRERAAHDTFSNTANDANVTGWRSAASIIGEKAVQRIRGFLAVSSAASVSNGANERPRIKVNDRQPCDIADDALSALIEANTPPKLFVRSGKLTRVRDDETGRPIIEVLTQDHLRERLGSIAEFYTTTKYGVSICYPPVALVQDIRARPRWDFPPLEAITETPTLRQDGTVLNAEGYDPATRLIYRPVKGCMMPSVPDHPTQGDVAHAVSTLNDVLCDFPFENEASRANAFALMLTPIIRPLIPLAPMALIDAPQAGSGKGLLTDVVSIIATGRPASKGSVPTDSDELEKKITSLLSAGSTFVVFDDVAQTLRSHVLASALTASEWTGRILGRSEMVAVPQRATWVVTGNNISLAGDIPRRCFQIRLDAKVSRPYLRDDFRHPNLESYVREHRGNLLSALLTLARAWHVAGCPETTVKLLGSFEQWTRIIGGILEHTGVKGFLGNANELYEQADEESSQWEGFIRSCNAVFGETAVTVSELANKCTSFPLISNLPDRLSETSISGKGNFKTLLGQSLAKRTDRRFGDEGWHVTRAGQDSNTKAARWRFTKTVQGGEGHVAR
jgi:hypothetical protein